MSNRAADAWRGFLNSHHDELVGGEITIYGVPPKGNFCGPISEIEIKDGKLVITTEWLAQNPMDRTGKLLGWRKAASDKVLVREFRTVWGHGEETGAPVCVKDKIYFTVEFRLGANIIPSGKLTSHNRLYRSKVHGL